MNEQITIDLQDGILLINKMKEWAIDMCNNIAILQTLYRTKKAKLQRIRMVGYISVKFRNS